MVQKVLTMTSTDIHTHSLAHSTINFNKEIERFATLPREISMSENYIGVAGICLGGTLLRPDGRNSRLIEGRERGGSLRRGSKPLPTI